MAARVRACAAVAVLAFPCTACTGSFVPPQGPQMLPVADGIDGEPSNCVFHRFVEAEFWGPSHGQGGAGELWTIAAGQLRRAAAATGANYVQLERFDWGGVRVNGREMGIVRGSAFRCQEPEEPSRTVVCSREPGLSTCTPVWERR